MDNVPKLTGGSNLQLVQYMIQLDLTLKSSKSYINTGDILYLHFICCIACINLLQPTAYVMHQQVFHSTDLRSVHAVLMFCIYLRTNSDLCHLQHKLIGFCSRNEKCLQRGTDWAFKYNSLRFVCKGNLVYVNHAL